MNLAVGVGIEPTFRVFQTRANPSQLSDPGTPGRIRTRTIDVRSVALFQLSYRSNERELERAVRLELTNTGFAIRRLSRLATRAIWNGRRDSNSRVEFGRLACFQLHHVRMNE